MLKISGVSVKVSLIVHDLNPPIGKLDAATVAGYFATAALEKGVVAAEVIIDGPS